MSKQQVNPALMFLLLTIGAVLVSVILFLVAHESCEFYVAKEDRPTFGRALCVSILIKKF